MGHWVALAAKPMMVRSPALPCWMSWIICCTAVGSSARGVAAWAGGLFCAFGALALLSASFRLCVCLSARKASVASSTAFWADLAIFSTPQLTRLPVAGRTMLFCTVLVSRAVIWVLNVWQIFSGLEGV